MKRKNIGIIVGSLRHGSFGKKLAEHMAGLLSGEFSANLLDISRLCIYNEDLDNDDEPPRFWQSFRNEVKASDGVLFVTPEYNRSVPPLLKNAIDIASRPRDNSAWDGKPGAIISISPGAIGGFGANNHLRQIAACVNMNIMAQPEAYIGNAAIFAQDSSVSDERVKGFLQKFAAAYAEWINRFTA